MTWGERGAICLACRIALPASGGCQQAGHEVVGLGRWDGRIRLEDRVWRSWHPVWSALRRGRLLRAADRARRRLRRRGPYGVYPVRDVDRETGPHGTVRTTVTAPPPWGGASCCAYALELRLGDDPWTAVTLHDAWTLGFAVELDDGRRVEVPSGPVVVSMRGALAEVVAPPALATYRRWLGDDGGDKDVFPHDTVATVRIGHGDRIMLAGELIPGVGGYRQRPVLCPALTPRVIPMPGSG